MESYSSGLSIRAITCMFDGPLMLQVNWNTVDTIHSKDNKLVMGMKINWVTGDSNLNDSPDLVGSRNTHCCAAETSGKGHTD